MLFDGTEWENDEMKETAPRTKTGRRMGHAPISGAQGLLAQLSGLAQTCTDPVGQTTADALTLSRDLSDKRLPEHVQTAAHHSHAGG